MELKTIKAIGLQETKKNFLNLDDMKFYSEIKIKEKGDYELKEIEKDVSFKIKFKTWIKSE